MRIIDATGTHKAVLHRRHGTVTLGTPPSVTTVTVRLSMNPFLMPSFLRRLAFIVFP